MSARAFLVAGCLAVIFWGMVAAILAAAGVIG